MTSPEKKTEITSLKFLYERSNPWDLIYKEGIPEDFAQPYSNFDKIIEILKQANSNRVLDVAMGAGRHSLVLAQEGFEVAGFDTSTSAISLAKNTLSEHGYEDVSLAIADMFDNYPYHDDSFDGVVAIQAIYHGFEHDMAFAFKEVHRILKAGMPFIFTITLSRIRSTLGAIDPIIKTIDEYTYLPLTGREKGLVHFTPDKKKLKVMLEPNFKDIIIIEDKVNKYFLVQCINRS